MLVKSGVESSQPAACFSSADKKCSAYFVGSSKANWQTPETGQRSQRAVERMLGFATNERGKRSAVPDQGRARRVMRERGRAEEGWGLVAAWIRTKQRPHVYAKRIPVSGTELDTYFSVSVSASVLHCCISACSSPILSPAGVRPRTRSLQGINDGPVAEDGTAE